MSRLTERKATASDHVKDSKWDQKQSEDPFGSFRSFEIRSAYEELRRLEEHFYSELAVCKERVEEIDAKAERVLQGAQEVEEEIVILERTTLGNGCRVPGAKESLTYEYGGGTGLESLKPISKRISGLEKRIQEQERDISQTRDRRHVALGELEAQILQRLANVRLKADAKFETFQGKIKEGKGRHLAELKEITARNLSETVNPTLQSTAEEINRTLDAFNQRIEDKFNEMKAAIADLPRAVEEKVDERTAETEAAVLEAKIERAKRQRACNLDDLTTFERGIRQDMEAFCEKVAMIQAQDTDAIECITTQFNNLVELVSRTQDKLEHVTAAAEAGTLSSFTSTDDEDPWMLTLETIEELQQKLQAISARLKHAFNQLGTHSGNKYKVQD